MSVISLESVIGSAPIQDAKVIGNKAQSEQQKQKEQLQEQIKDKRYKLHRRFDRLGRLYGDGAVERLMQSKVVIFGVGGVGSFAAEALARSAVGHILLVDFDEVCVTNVNRQLQALKGNVGKSKAMLLAERLKLINPQAKIEYKHLFYNAARSEEMLTNIWDEHSSYDFVLDCIDNMTAKAHLIATCKQKNIPLIASMGAAGKIDPTQIKLSDLNKTTNCRMARELKRLLRRNYGPEYGFEKRSEKPFGVQVVYSTEQRNWPRSLSYDAGEGFKCVCPHKNPEHGCDSRSLIDGTAVFVTGAFGLMMGSHVINTLVSDIFQASEPAQDRYGYVKQ